MAEPALWAAVILQAIDDAKRRPRPRDGGRKAKQAAEARAWLTEPNPDFERACSLAGMDAEAVRDWARREIAALVAIGEPLQG